MRNWNRLSVMLPAGLAMAALVVPFGIAPAENSPPTNRSAAVEQPPRQSPHFFTGNPALSGFQGLAMPSAPEPPPVHLSTVTVLPVSEVEVPVIPRLNHAAVRPAVAPDLPGAIELNRPLVSFASHPIKRVEPALVRQVAAEAEPSQLPAPAAAKAQFTTNLPQATLRNPADMRLQPAAVAESFGAEALTNLPKPALIRLPPPGPEPTAPLVATEVQPVASPPTVPSEHAIEFDTTRHDEFHLASLKSAPSATNSQPTDVNAQTVAVYLQPAEVLPMQDPRNPSFPRIPAVDAERPIGAVTTSVAPPTGRLPSDLAIERFRDDYPAYLPRGWEGTVYFWDAPSMCIGPLRYEEANLERLGYSHCPILQPALSGVRFLGSTLALPYTLATNPPGTCKYPLGHYRPGSPAPYRHIWPEASVLGASSECVAIAGLILLIP